MVPFLIDAVVGVLVHQLTGRLSWAWVLFGIIVVPVTIYAAKYIEGLSLPAPSVPGQAES